MSKKIEFCESEETKKRQREVQLIINIVEPDPEFQPTFVSDAACFYDITGKDEKDTEANLRYYFKGELPASLNTPIWQFIDLVKLRYPGWPDEWPSKQ